MKVRGIVFGLAALIAAGSANAAIIYDTITDQTATGNKLLLAQQNHAPMGNMFSVAYPQTIASVEVQLVDANATATTHVTDSGSILVYLVPSVSNLPSATGITLTNKIYLGTVLDTALLGGGVANNITLNPGVTVAAGDYWIMLTSGSDPLNFFGTRNVTPSTAGWAEIAASTVPATDLSAYTNPGNTAFAQQTNGFIFMAQVDAPEPASLLVLGSGLVALGLRRRRATKPASDAACA